MSGLSDTEWVAIMHDPDSGVGDACLVAIGVRGGTRYTVKARLLYPEFTEEPEMIPRTLLAMNEEIRGLVA